MADLESLISKLIMEGSLPDEINLTRKQLAEKIIALEIPGEILIDDLIYDHISDFSEPTHISGYYVIWNEYFSRLILKKLASYGGMEELMRTHEQVIEQILKEKISSLSPRYFEHYIFKLLSQSNDFTRIRLSPATRDGGIDLSCFFYEEDTRIRLIFEAKKLSRPVGPSVVDRLISVMKFEKKKWKIPVRGVIVSLNGFTEGARKRANSENMEFWDINTLIRLSKDNEVGIKKFVIPIIDDDEWDNYEIIGD